MAYHSEIPKQPSVTPDLCACPGSVGQLDSRAYFGKGICLISPGRGCLATCGHQWNLCHVASHTRDDGAWMGSCLPEELCSKMLHMATQRAWALMPKAADKGGRG